MHTPSQFVADEVVAELGVDPSGSVRCTTGYPRCRWIRPCPRRRPFALPDGCRRYVLAIGTIEPRKDYPLLVSAFASVAAAHPDVALVVVGGDGWGAERFAAAVAASPCRLPDRPARLPRRPALGAASAGASVLAYPSLYEGFGFPPLQAMAAGVPVVATAAGAIPEVVGDGALLVGPGDGDAAGGRHQRRPRRRDRGRCAGRPGPDPGRGVHLGGVRRTGWPCSTATPTAPRAVRVGPLARSKAMSDLRLLMLAEQLRRPASGGIGTYVRGLIQGLDCVAARGERPSSSCWPAGPRDAVVGPTSWPVSATRCTVRCFPGRC